MKVKELVKKLQSFDEDAEVLLSANEPFLDREVNRSELISITYNSYFNNQDNLVKEVELYGKKSNPNLWDIN